MARVADQPALRRNAERRYGSLEAYAEARAQADEAELTHDAEAATASYDAARREHLAAVYEAGRRDGALLGGVEELDWLLGGAADPRGDRNDLFARWGRRRSAAQLGDAHRDASTNRLQAYDDEAAVLARAAAAARAAGHADRAAAIDEVLGVVRTTRALDQELQQGSGPIQLDSPGILGALERAGG